MKIIEKVFDILIKNREELFPLLQFPQENIVFKILKNNNFILFNPQKDFYYYVTTIVNTSNCNKMLYNLFAIQCMDLKLFINDNRFRIKLIIINSIKDGNI